MKLSNNGEKTWVSCPKGNHHAVCVDAYRVGWQYSEFYDSWSYKLVLVFQTEKKISQKDTTDEGLIGKPYLISKWVTASMNERSTLRQLLESWEGEPFTEQEIQNFTVEEPDSEGPDLTDWIGKNCTIQVMPNPKNPERTVLKNIFAANEHAPHIEPVDYVRKALRDDYAPIEEKVRKTEDQIADEIPF